MTTEDEASEAADDHAGGERPPEVVFDIALVEDDPLIQRVVTATLATEPGLRVVGTAVSAASAETVIGSAQPDLVILDNQLAGRMTGIELAPRLRRAWPEMWIVLFTSDSIAAPPDSVDALVRKHEIHLLVPTIRVLLRLPLDVTHRVQDREWRDSPRS